MTQTPKRPNAMQVVEFVATCNRAVERGVRGLILFTTPDDPFYSHQSLDGNAELSLTGLRAIVRDREALAAALAEGLSGEEHLMFLLGAAVVAPHDLDSSLALQRAKEWVVRARAALAAAGVKHDA